MSSVEEEYLAAVRKVIVQLKQTESYLQHLVALPESRRREWRKQRSISICRAIAGKGGIVTEDELNEIAFARWLPYHAIGVLFRAGYLHRRDGGIGLGPRGTESITSVVTKAGAAER